MTTVIIHKFTKEDREGWAKWLLDFGVERFFDSFMSNAQFAAGTCQHCNHQIFLDIAEGGGVPDWRTENGDYGCHLSPETSEEGCGSHMPVRLKFEAPEPLSQKEPS